MISGFSVLSALFIYSIALIPACLLRRSTEFLKKGGTSVLLLLSAFATARLLLPFEVPVTFAVDSWNVLGVFLEFFRTYPAFTRLMLVAWGIGAIVVTGRDIADLYRAHKQCLQEEHVLPAPSGHGTGLQLDHVQPVDGKYGEHLVQGPRLVGQNKQGADYLLKLFFC